MNDLFTLYYSIFPLLLQGVFVTVQVSVCALMIGGTFGTILGLLNCNLIRFNPFSTCIDIYVAVIRGTPVFVQVLIIYFGLSDVIGYSLSPLQAGGLALGINSTAYLAEIVRGGLNAVPKGQWEAGQALGYSKSQALLYLVLPQAAWSSMPAIVNEMISLVKESSILMVVGVTELTKVSKDLVSHQLKPVEIYLLCALLYLVITSSLQLMGNMLERYKVWTY